MLDDCRLHEGAQRALAFGVVGVLVVERREDRLAPFAGTANASARSNGWAYAQRVDQLPRPIERIDRRREIIDLRNVSWSARLTRAPQTRRREDLPRAPGSSGDDDARRCH